jgi:proton-translocating NADH-quinone oxidoreductase chain N
MTATWLIAVPLIAGPIAYLVGRAGPSARNGRGSAAAWWVALAALIAAAAGAVPVARALADGGEPAISFGGLALRFDGLGFLLAVVGLVLAVGAVLVSRAEDAGDAKYYAVLLLLAGTVIGVGGATDLVNLWIWFEAMAAASYVLVAFHRERRTSLEAAVKYLTQGAVGSSLVLVGIAVILARTGTLDLAALAGRHGEAGTLGGAGESLAGAFLIIGFGIKAAFVPLHTWLPDAHAEAPSGISAMLSGIVIQAGLLAMLRVLAAVSSVTVSWGAILLGFAALNLLIGNLLALGQTQVKRLLAFSSVSQIGYMLLGFGIAARAGVPAAAEGGALHLVAHALMKGLAFLAAGAFVYALPVAGRAGSGLVVEDLAGAAQRYPVVAAALSVAVLGLGGLPPLAGFMSKWQIFAAGLLARDPIVTGLVVFAALNTVLSLAYYAPIVSVLYRRVPSAGVRGGRAVPAAMHVPLVALAVAVLVIGVWPAAVRWLVAPAGAAILRAVAGGVP